MKKMDFLDSLFYEIGSSMIIEWLKLRDINIKEVDDDVDLLEEEWNLIRRYIAQEDKETNKYKFFIYDDIDHEYTRYVVFINQDFSVQYFFYNLDEEGNIVNTSDIDKNTIIHLNNLNCASNSGWTKFLINKLGDNFWNYYFFEELDALIFRDYIVSSEIVSPPEDFDFNVTLLFETDDYKTFFFIDNFGYEYRALVNYKGNCFMYMSKVPIYEVNFEAKKMVKFIEVSRNIDFYTFSKTYYNPK